MDPFNSLSVENHDQIRKYIRFFRQKKDGILRSLQREINDIKAERLNEDMYTKDDMQEFADFLMSAIRVWGDCLFITFNALFALLVDVCIYACFEHH